MMSAADEIGEPALGLSRVGAELRAARLRLGWKLPDVAASLRIRLPYLEAIEEGRLSDLPGNAYAMGFLRSYAAMLGLDAAEVARRFRAEAQEVNRKPVLEFPAPVPERGVPAGAVILLGLVIAAGAYGAWWKYSDNTPPPPPVVPMIPERLAALAPQSNPSPQVASVLPSPAPGAVMAPVVQAAPPPPPMPAPPPTPAAPPVEASRMVLRSKTGGWVEVKEKQGAVLYRHVMKAGETWAVPKGTPVLLTSSNIGGIEVLMDGVALPSLGAVGAFKRDVLLDPDAGKVGAPTPAPRSAAAPSPSAPLPQ